MELNNRNIPTATPGTILRDATIPGLHLKVSATKKAYYLYFRTKDGMERRPKLGDHGIITLEQARKLAKEMLGVVASGKDPIVVRNEAKDAPTLGKLWERYWKDIGQHKKSAYGRQFLYNKHLAPRFGNRKLSSITYETLADLKEEMADTPIQFNRVKALLSKLFNFAIAPLKWATENPCRGVVTNKENKRKRKATREELARLVDRLRVEMDGPQREAAVFIWLLLTTGARKGELANATWADLHGSRLLIGDHKTDSDGEYRVIQLPNVSLEALSKLPQTSGPMLGIKSPYKLWNRIRNEEGFPDLRIHDLRRTYASVAISVPGTSIENVMQRLGHKSAQTTKVYAWLMEDALAQATEDTADAMLRGHVQKPLALPASQD